MTYNFLTFLNFISIIANFIIILFFIQDVIQSPVLVQLLNNHRTGRIFVKRFKVVLVIMEIFWVYNPYWVEVISYPQVIAKYIAFGIFWCFHRMFTTYIFPYIISS